MESIIRNVPDIPPSQREAIESLLGHALGPDQQVCILVLPAQGEPDAQRRQMAWKELRQFSQRLEERMRASGITPDQWDAAVNEACHEVRYGDAWYNRSGEPAGS